MVAAAADAMAAAVDMVVVAAVADAMAAAAVMDVVAAAAAVVGAAAAGEVSGDRTFRTKSRCNTICTTYIQ